MLSICISIYQFDSQQLIQELHKQALALKLEFEIIAIDDNSEKKYQTVNKSVSALKQVYYSENRENTGRSRIRNQMAKLARHENLLFIDCDAQLVDNQFIKRYFHASEKAKIVCGGTAYRSQKPEKQFLLHWNYGRKREMRPASDRNKNPNRSFSSFNFWIKRKIMLQFPFNEDISGYGHEDTLLGFVLEENNYEILHIDNPLIHNGLNTNKRFLENTKNGIYNLSKLLKQEKKLLQKLKLSRVYNKLQSFYLGNLFGFFFRLTERSIKTCLEKNIVSIWLLDIYKLGKLHQFLRAIANSNFKGGQKTQTDYKNML